MTKQPDSVLRIGDRLTDNANFDITVTDVLGGGMGAVGIGIDKRSNNAKRVVKTLKTDAMQHDADSIARFQREALLWTSIWPHPNIVRCYGLVTMRSLPFVVLNYMPGGSLQNWLDTYHREHARLALKDALDIAQQIIAGLVALHDPAGHLQIPDPAGRQRPARPLIHRDLKPDNILFDGERWAITDFGLATELADEEEAAAGEQAPTLSQATATNGMYTQNIHGGGGTFPYMPVEQWLSNRVTPAADIYAFGIMVSEMFAGRHPYAREMYTGILQGKNQQEVYFQAHAYARPQSLQEGNALVIPDALEALYQACLAKEATQRPSAIEVQQQLWALAAAQGMARGTGVRKEPTMQEQAVRWGSTALVLAELQRYDEALASYDRALALDPNDAAAWSNRGLTLDHMQRYEEALASYDRALALDPNDAAAWSNRGLTLDHMQCDDEALASYDRALALDPTYVPAWSNRGATLDKMQRYEEALASFDRALALDPALVDAWGGRGNMLADMQRYKEALASFDRVLALDPSHVNTWYNRGNTLKKMQRDEEALASYDRALALDPALVDAWSNRAVTLAQMGHLTEAEASVQQAIRLQPANGHFWRVLSFIYQSMGRTDEAARAAARAQALQ